MNTSIGKVKNMAKQQFIIKSKSFFGSHLNYRRITNELWKNDKRIARKDITNYPDNAFYKDGKVVTALMSNWKEFL